MQHQVLADEAGGVGQAVGVLGGGGEQEQARGADAVGADDDRVGELSVFDAFAVDPQGALGAAVLAGEDPADSGAGDQDRPGAQGVRPEGDVGGGLGALRTAPLAGAPTGALGQLLELLARDRVGARPPVPAQRVHARGRPAARLAQGVRGQRVVESLRVGGIAAEAGDADEPVHPVVVRGEVGVGDGPVVAHAVEAADGEVGRQQTRPLGAVEEAGAADRVVHDRRHVRVGQVQRVVRRQIADVRVVGPLVLDQQLPLGVVDRVVRRVDPVALLQADHAETACGQRVRDDPAGGPGADDENVGHVARC